MWTDELLDGLRREADPEADAVVAEHLAAAGPDARALVRAVAGHGHHRSDALDRYDAEQPALPPWADAAALAEGERFFELWAPQVLSALLLASLPEAYAGAKGVQVLHLTARLATDTRRRLVETTQMVVDVMTPGGLLPGRPGYRTARRVRLMHAAVRHLVASDERVRRTCEPTPEPHWCDEWGVPINQEDLLGTLMTFTWTVFESLDRMGARYDPGQAAAYLHAWNVAGALLGIRPDLLPVDMAGAAELSSAVRRRQQAPSPAGREMTAALLEVASSAMRPRVLSGLPASFSRYLVGDRVAGIVALPRRDWTALLFRPGRRVLAAVSAAERHDRLLQRLAERANRSVLEAFLVAERGVHRPPFALPDHLAAACGVRPGAVRDGRAARARWRTAGRTGPGDAGGTGRG